MKIGFELLGKNNMQFEKLSKGEHMETKHTAQSSLQKVIFFVTILLISSVAYGDDPNSTAAPKKPEAKKSTEIKSLSVKPTRPTTSPSSFRPDMPLREALDILSHATNPPLNIVVKWKDLDENADITPDTPIGMSGLSRASIKTYLNVLLITLSTETAELGYVVDGNVIIIGTKNTLPKKIVTRTYDIADIVAPPSMGGMMGMGMGGMMGGYGSMMGGYGNMMGGYGNMMGGYGMSSYGTYGNQYGTGYNQNYMNQNYYQGYNQNNRPYGYQTSPGATGFGIMMGM